MPTSVSRSVSVAARKQSAGGPTLFEQVLAIPDILLMLRADLGITIGTGVSDWEDHVSGFVFSQATGSAQPVPSTALGFETLLFDGSDLLTYTGTLSAAAAGEWFHVQHLAADPPVGVAGVVHRNVGAGAASTHIPFSDGVVYDDFASTVRKTAGSSGGSLAGLHQYNARSAAGAWSCHIDGVQLYSTGTNSVGWGTNPEIGASGSNGIAGHIAEILIFERVLTAEERSLVGAYHEDRYGVTIA